MSGKFVCEIFSDVTFFYNNCKNNIKFGVGEVAIKMTDIVLCGVKNTPDLAIEATSDSTMVQALMIDRIQKYRSAFYS